ncbi:hypothetical protein ACVW1A_007835 [Bradyrhizobium sp. LB1.3]
MGSAQFGRVGGPTRGARLTSIVVHARFPKLNWAVYQSALTSVDVSGASIFIAQTIDRVCRQLAGPITLCRMTVELNLFGR